MSVVEVKVHAPSGTITLNRPEKRNAISREVLRELTVALNDLRQETRVRAVVLTGSGSTFSSGLDLEEMHETSQSEDAWERWHDDVMRFREMIEVMLNRDSRNACSQ